MILDERFNYSVPRFPLFNNSDNINTLLIRFLQDWNEIIQEDSLASCLCLINTLSYLWLLMALLLLLISPQFN